MNIHFFSLSNDNIFSQIISIIWKILEFSWSLLKIIFLCLNELISFIGFNHYWNLFIDYCQKFKFLINNVNLSSGTINGWNVRALTEENSPELNNIQSRSGQNNSVTNNNEVDLQSHIVNTTSSSLDRISRNQNFVEFDTTDVTINRTYSSFRRLIIRTSMTYEETTIPRKKSSHKNYLLVGHLNKELVENLPEKIEIFGEEFRLR